MYYGILAGLSAILAETGIQTCRLSKTYSNFSQKKKCITMQMKKKYWKLDSWKLLILLNQSYLFGNLMLTTLPVDLRQVVTRLAFLIPST